MAINQDVSPLFKHSRVLREGPKDTPTDSGYEELNW